MKSLFVADSKTSDVSWNSGPSEDTRTGSGFIRGYGALMEQQYLLQSVTNESGRSLTGSRSKHVRRMLEKHYIKIGDSISLLARFCDDLPQPGRFRTWLGERSGTAGRWQALRAHSIHSGLAQLLALHTKVMAEVGMLTDELSLGDEGRQILSEVARNHEDMASMLTDVVKKDVSIGDQEIPPIIARGLSAESEAR